MLLDTSPQLSKSNTSTFNNDSKLSIKGRIKETGKSIPCRVRLFEKLSGSLIGDISTDENGFYEFNHLTKTKFFIVIHHPQNQFNAVIQDNVVPK